ncbi:hypothetical protein GGTG_02150 [Gaeumannomyces tritici R3-111a-1]|uniref:TRP C-terminal domain-containing protein n=1 Tax=Gaeumannomyces tritici (strain R3-111a-1) TaxID=644352 RepID=J3NLK1_GAET3|nr:hypothetical protein GGTG_02150 [Gaeumannomyces tritici R3-111a-1]EJT82176.1 hypothetical protein GGTG_02150 [Gaeumannomyces tritici R3-111a-1]
MHQPSVGPALYDNAPARRRLDRHHAPMSSRSRLRWLFALALAACRSLPTAHAVGVQFLPCDVVDGIAVSTNASNGTAGLVPYVRSVNTKLLPGPAEAGSGTSTGHQLSLVLDIEPKASLSCEDQARQPWNLSLGVTALGLSLSKRGSPQNVSCYLASYPPNNTKPFDYGPKLMVKSQVDVGPLGVLPTFALRVSFESGPQGPKSPICIYAEITPALSDTIALAARIVPILIFVLVVVSGFLTTMYKQPIVVDMAHSRWAGQVPLQEHPESPPARAILPGVGDCLLHLQFIFLMGALTVRYPGFYQPVVSKMNWAVLFSPSGPIGMQAVSDGVGDGIYWINGTLTGTDGISLLSQVSGTAMTTYVFWNMLLLAGLVAIAVALVLKISPMVPSIRAKFTASPDAEARPHQTAMRTTWNVLRVVFSYFLQPLVAFMTYQLTSNILPVWQLVLIVTLMVLVICGIAWVSTAAPLNQLGTLLLGGSKKKYRSLHQGAGNDGQAGEATRHRWFDSRASFTIIFFVVAFMRGAMIGGVQSNPIGQLAIMALLEFVLLASTAILNPFPSFALVFICSCLARLAVVVLTIIFLPQLRADIGTRMAVGYTILAIHAAVLLFACAVPAVLRLARVWFRNMAVFDEPEIYGVSQLTRRRTNYSNGLRAPEQGRDGGRRSMDPRAPATPLLSPHSPHNSGDAGISVTVRTVPQHHAFRAPRTQPSLASLSSYTGGLTPLDGSHPRSPLTPAVNDASAHLFSSQTRDASLDPTGKPWRRQSSESLRSDGATLVNAEAPVPLQKAHAPLASRWKDYSFREADLYYGTPPPDDDDDDDKEVRGGGPSSSSLSSRPKKPTVWVQLTTRRAASAGNSSGSSDSGSKKGFEVRRPPRPPGMAPPASMAKPSTPAPAASSNSH